jgi:hypothetical protein
MSGFEPRMPNLSITSISENGNREDNKKIMVLFVARERKA